LNSTITKTVTRSGKRVRKGPAPVKERDKINSAVGITMSTNKIKFPITKNLGPPKLANASVPSNKSSSDSSKDLFMITQMEAETSTLTPGTSEIAKVPGLPSDKSC